MKIAVIAANGRTGKVFVETALKNGHSVKAGVYGQYDFDPAPSLEVLECDATNQEQLEKLISDCDAVASFIGHGKNSPATVQTDAIDNAIAVCNKLGIRRIVSQTGTGVRFNGDKITLMDRLLNMSISIIDPKRVKDGIAHVESLKNSNLDWTVIRVLKLNNSDTSSYSLFPSGPVKTFNSRLESAQAAIEVLENNSFIKQAPIISKKS